MIENPGRLTEALKEEARRLGFQRVGIAPAEEPDDYPRLLDWLSRGDQAGMDYMVRQAEARRSPQSLLEGVRSVVMVSLLHGPSRDPDATFRVARYAQGPDYHEVLWRRLEQLLAWLAVHVPEVRGRVVADTAPLLERDFARRAGLGWIGKNTLLIDPKIGSFTVLGAILVDIPLAYDRPFETFHCGTCTRCLDACPTDAFNGPFSLDARKCLSYWTIEHKGEIPEPIAERMGEWLFGCDICQDVCPWNRKVKAPAAPEWAEPNAWSKPDPLEWLAADPAEFARRLKGTALSRSKRRGLLRNAILALANRMTAEIRSAIERLRDDPEPLIRATAEQVLKRAAQQETSH